jgi:hypothetical protein
MPPPPPVA